jgi:uncharacterized protein YkwD
MHRKVLFVVVALCFTLLLRGKEPTKDAPFEMTAAEKELLDLTNAEREKVKLAPLKPNPILFKAARAHSANMAKQKKMSHVLDGKNPANRVDAVGYDFGLIGENIAYTTEGATLKAVLQGWMDSKVHRENMLKPGYQETGFGIAKNDDGESYYTQVFARPRKRR